MVLEDVTEFDYSGQNTKMSKILLNGNNVCMVGPSSDQAIQGQVKSSQVKTKQDQEQPRGEREREREKKKKKKKML